MNGQHDTEITEKAHRKIEASWSATADPMSRARERWRAWCAGPRESHLSWPIVRGMQTQPYLLARSWCSLFFSFVWLAAMAKAYRTFTIKAIQHQ